MNLHILQVLDRYCNSAYNAISPSLISLLHYALWFLSLEGISSYSCHAAAIKNWSVAQCKVTVMLKLKELVLS